MGSIVRCLLRNCFEYGEGNGDDEYDPPLFPPPPTAIIRGASTGIGRSISAPVRSGYGPAASDGMGGIDDILIRTDPHDMMEGGDDDCCGEEGRIAAGGRASSLSFTVAAEDEHEGSTTAESASPSYARPDVATGLRAFFGNFGLGRMRDPYDSLGHPVRSGSGEASPPLSAAFNPQSFPRGGSLSVPGGGNGFGVVRRTVSEPMSKEGLKTAVTGVAPRPHLHAASSFHYDASQSGSVPAICLDEVVLPGSEIQMKMADLMRQNLEEQDDECVICMEGFDPTNPRMPTLCGCGENKTYFHLPCLLHWIQHNRNCPSCRKRLRWEEF